MNGRDPWLVAVVLLAFAVRAGLLLLYPDVRGAGDETTHLVHGVLVRHFGQQAIHLWGPGYEALLAAVFWIAGPDPLAAKAVQVLLSTALVAVVYALGHRTGGARAARIAGLACALDPTLAAYSHYLYSETLFALLLAGAAALLHRRAGQPTRLESVAAGVLFGVAGLTRSVILLFPPAWLAFAALRRRGPEARTAALVCGVAFAVVLPWTLRNARVYRDFLLVDATAGIVASKAYEEELFNRDLARPRSGPPPPSRSTRCPRERRPGADPFPEPAALRALFPPKAVAYVGSPHVLDLLLEQAREFATLDLPAYQRCQLAGALEFLTAHPARMAAHWVARVELFFGPNSFLLRTVDFGLYRGGPLDRRHYTAVKAAVVAFHVLVIGAAILAFASPRPPPLLRWFALLALFYTAVHVVSLAYSRYRLPLMPLAMVAGAHWLAAPRWPEGRLRRAATAAALAAFAALCVRYLRVWLP
jgi:4-amino-4-deoxy-L-arabinose transferase-like glycosyltransferase